MPGNFGSVRLIPENLSYREGEIGVRIGLVLQGEIHRRAAGVAALLHLHNVFQFKQAALVHVGVEIGPHCRVGEVGRISGPLCATGGEKDSFASCF